MRKKRRVGLIAALGALPTVFALPWGLVILFEPT